MACNDFPNDPTEGLIFDTGEGEQFIYTGGKWVIYNPPLNHQDLEGRDDPTAHPEFSGAGSTFFVPDPVTQSGLFLQDDGNWATPEVFFVTATVTDVDPGLDEIWTDVNSFDFTGHPQASGTALGVAVNASLSVSNDTDRLWRYTGPKPVLLGVGGNYTTDADDWGGRCG